MSCRNWPTSTRPEDGCVSEPLARSPIPARRPVTVTAGWEVSAVRAAGDLTLTDCTPLAKVLVRAPATGRVAAELAVPFGRAARDPAGVLVAGAGAGGGLPLPPPRRTPHPPPPVRAALAPA